MLKLQRLRSHTRWYSDDEALSFVVDLEELGVEAEDYVEKYHLVPACEIYLVAGPELDPESARPQRSHWIN